MNTSAPRLGPLSTRLPEMLWSAWRDDLSVTFEVQAYPPNRKNPPLPYKEALRACASGKRALFGVVPRKQPANNKLACVDEHNVLFADIDREGVDPARLADEIKDILDPALWPSSMVYSGRAGLHLYWMLDSRISIDLVQGYSKALSVVLGGDTKCHSCDQLLRIPGTRNTKPGGGLVEEIEIGAHVIAVDALAALLPDVRPIPRVPLAASRTATASASREWLVLEKEYDHWGELGVDDEELEAALSDGLYGYLVERPAKGWRRGKRTRNEMEMSIACRLVRRGWSDADITELAEEFFARHIDEGRQGKGDGYLHITLDKARDYALDRLGLVTSRRGGNPRRANPVKRRQTDRDRASLLSMVNGQSKTELVREAQPRFGRSRSALFGDLRDMERVGDIETRDRRIHKVVPG